MVYFVSPLAQFHDAAYSLFAHRVDPSRCIRVIPRDRPAVVQLLALLEARYAIRVLWALRDGHAQTFRLLQDSVGGVTPNTLNTRIKELRAADLMTHGPDGYVITLVGADLVRRLGELPAFAHKWAAAQAKKASAPPALPPGELDGQTPAS
jgi:DNA-binding HxlR family transcriptional regulator